MMLSTIALHLTTYMIYLNNIISFVTELLHYMIIIATPLNTYIRQQKKRIPKLYKFLHKWKFNIARLNDEIDLYYKINYKVIDYMIKKPNMRITDLTRTPYGHRKWKQRQSARNKCITSKHFKEGQQTIITYKTTSGTYKRMHFDSDSFEIMVDNCCSKSITHCLSDFIDKPTQGNAKIKGYNGTSNKQLLTGTVKWTVQDDSGRVHDFIIPNTLYSSETGTRLFSPQHWAQTREEGRGAKCTTYHDAIILTWNNWKHQKTIPLTKQSRNVGIMTSAPGITNYSKAMTTISQINQCIAFPTTIDCTFDDTEINHHDKPLDQPTKATKTQSTTDQTENGITDQTENGIKQKPIKVIYKEPEQRGDMPEQPTYQDERHEYLKWHYKLNHASYSTMSRMAQKKLLPHFISKKLKKMEKTGEKPPLCNDCYSAAACKTAWRHKPNKGETKNRRENLAPGDVVSVDQIESSIPGLLAQITGSLTRKRIVGSSVYVDHGSDLSYIYHHTSMSSEEALKGKESFEQFAKTHGVHIKHYHVDNGRFKDNLFMKAIERNNQTISFSGVGAHHQNGIAEKRIGDLQRRATALLLHAERRWPDAINSHLWPYAMRAANDSRNNFPNKNSLECPISKFTRSGKDSKLGNLHHFGCPVYVLKKEIQDGKKAKKWTERTRIGIQAIHLGNSPRHAQNVSLILNLETGLVSPQFHCNHDDLFETTTGPQARSIPKSKWKIRAGFAPHEDDIFEPHEHEEYDQRSDEEGEEGSSSQDEGAEQDMTQETHIPYQTRSGRTIKKPERLNYMAFESILEPYDYEEEDAWCEMEMLTYKASTDPDTMYYHQAMREPDKDKFKEAIRKECEDHFRESNYKLVEISKVPKDAPLLSSVWKMKRKRKPSTGEISKYKARMNVNGKEQVKGVHYDETYAPVVGWATIRFFMSLAIVNNWSTRQLDFLLAYTQADIERDLYMKIPSGLVVNGKTLDEQERKRYALQLEKNLYGQKQAGRVWYLHLKKNLEKIGFKASKYDECRFYYGTTIFILYTDDTILMGPDQKEIDMLVRNSR
jgi:transposase InsO family protein